MNSPQLDLIKAPSPEDVVRENLEKAMIRYGGDINAYYAELLKKLPLSVHDAELETLQRFAALRLHARR